MTPGANCFRCPSKARNAWTGFSTESQVVVSGSATRYFSGGKWSSRENTNITSTNTAREIENLRPGDSHTALRIEKKNDKWTFHLVEIGGGDLDPDEFATKKISCRAAMSDNPGK